MKKYSVKDVADLLSTNPETVRRWIRKHKLKANIDSRKGGNSISEAELKKFLKNNAKYGAIAASSLALFPVGGMAVLFGGILRGIIGEKTVSELNLNSSKLEKQDIVNLLNDEVNKRKNSICKAREKLKEIDEEIREHERAIDVLNATLKRLDTDAGKKEDNFEL